jgi:Flp pilus assembly protein TadD
MAVPELPVRVTSYANQDPGGGRVSVVIAADVGQPGAPAAEFTVGFAVVDRDNKVVASSMERKRLTPADGRPDAPLTYMAAIALDPGSYTLRFGAVDAAGRRGTVLRPLAAWQMIGQEFSAGDLVVGNASDRTSDRLVPAVEPRVHDGRLAAFVNLHAASPATFDQTTVTMDVASDESGSAIASTKAELVASAHPGMRIAAALVPVQALPPGRYLARATIVRDGKPAGQLSRPFVIVARAAGDGDAAGPMTLPTSLFTAPPPLEAKQALQPAVLGTMLEGLERSTPSLAPAVASARAGEYRAAALAAFEAGHQQAASLLQGLDLLRQGQLDKAAAQFNIAAGPRRDFYPAAFYLGTCYAVSGRDRDAAGVWQQALGTAVRPPIAYVWLADARFRAGQPTAVIEVLQAALARWPNDDEVARRLGLALVMAGRHREAGPVLDGYLGRHPSDQEALLAAVVALHPSNSGQPLDAADRARLERYAAAYRGPQRALVTRYLDALR